MYAIFISFNEFPKANGFYRGDDMNPGVDSLNEHVVVCKTKREANHHASAIEQSWLDVQAVTVVKVLPRGSY